MIGDAESGPGTDPESLWTVTYNAEPADLLATYRSMTRRNLLRYGPTLAVAFALMGALAGWIVGRIGIARPTPAAAVGATLGVAALAALFVRTERRVVREGHAAGYYGPQTLTICPEGFEHSRGDGRSVSKGWGEVLKVGTTPLDFVIMLHDGTALAMPRRAFRSEGQESLFAGFAGAWHAQARGAGASEAGPVGEDAH